MKNGKGVSQPSVQSTRPAKRADLERSELAERARREERDEDRRREEERWQQEITIREREYQMHCRAQDAKIAEDNSLLGRTKKFATAIKDVFPQMPKDSAELPTYFESVESIFFDVQSTE